MTHDGNLTSDACALQDAAHDWPPAQGKLAPAICHSSRSRVPPLRELPQLQEELDSLTRVHAARLAVNPANALIFPPL